MTDKLTIEDFEKTLETMMKPQPVIHSLHCFECHKTFLSEEISTHFLKCDNHKGNDKVFEIKTLNSGRAINAISNLRLPKKFERVK